MTDFQNTYDVAIIGGGPIGLSAAYEVAKEGYSVVVLERNNFFNQAGSSGDLARMFRTIYTEDFMADLAYKAMGTWETLEKDAGVKLRLMTGLLNFGDQEYDAGGPEGTLMDPIKNLDRLKMKYEKLSKNSIEDRYPFRNLPDKYVGIYAPDNGVINVPLLVRTLYRLCRDRGASMKEYTHVQQLNPDGQIWDICAYEEGIAVSYRARKVIIASGAYINHILRPSFKVKLELDIWEMVASYWSLKAGSDGTKFSSMWFQFQGDVNGKSQLFYGFPALPWGPPDVARIAVNAATCRIKDPNDRSPSHVSADDIAATREFVESHLDGVNPDIPVFNSTCLQTNVFGNSYLSGPHTACLVFLTILTDNMFVMDYLPVEYLNSGAANSVVVFTAGWAMKFVPLIGQGLKDMAIKGGSPYARPEFSISRRDSLGNPLLKEDVI